MKDACCIFGFGQNIRTQSRSTRRFLQQVKTLISIAVLWTFCAHDFAGIASANPVETKPTAVWSLDAGPKPLKYDQLKTRTQEFGSQPFVDLLRVRTANESRIAQLRARMTSLSEDQNREDLPDSALQAAWTRIHQLFDEEFWPIELRRTLTELWIQELLRQAHSVRSDESRSRVLEMIRLSRPYLSPREWRIWRKARQKTVHASPHADLESFILENWESQLKTSTQSGRVIKLPKWTQAYDWLRFEDQLIEISSSSQASVEVFLPNRDGRIELLSSRFESFAKIGPFLSAFPQSFTPKLWWAEPCLYVDRKDLSVRDQIPESLRPYSESGELWPIGEPRFWPRCDEIKASAHREQQNQLREDTRLAPEARTWSITDSKDASQLESSSRRWLWVGLAVLLGGVYWHQHARSAQGETRPTQREGF